MWWPKIISVTVLHFSSGEKKPGDSCAPGTFVNISFTSMSSSWQLMLSRVIIEQPDPYLALMCCRATPNAAMRVSKALTASGRHNRTALPKSSKDAQSKAACQFFHDWRRSFWCFLNETWWENGWETWVPVPHCEDRHRQVQCYDVVSRLGDCLLTVQASSRHMACRPSESSTPDVFITAVITTQHCPGDIQRSRGQEGSNIETLESELTPSRHFLG